MTEPSASPARPSIMLVEDNDMIGMLIEELLSAEYEEELFADAESALERAKERPFDLVLMDVTLPKMSGVDAMKALRVLPEYADTPIVAMTGLSSPAHRAEYLAAGFTEHLGKPFLPDELFRIIESLLPG